MQRVTAGAPRTPGPSRPPTSAVAPRRAAAGRVLLVVAVVAWAATVVAQVSSALVADPRPLVVTTVVLLTVATWCLLARTTAYARAALALVAAALLGFVAEVVGTNTGVPFGPYDYTGRLLPAVATVPVVVPLAWFAMGVPAYVIATAVVGARRTWPHRLLRAVVGAVALTAWDLFLDPQMVGLGYWTWPHGGAYHGIPLSNFAGWLLVSFLLVLLLDALVPQPAASRGLLGLYTSMTVIETVGFLGPLAFRPELAVTGGLAMGAVCAAGWLALHVRPGRRARKDQHG